MTFSMSQSQARQGSWQFSEQCPRCLRQPFCIVPALLDGKHRQALTDLLPSVELHRYRAGSYIFRQGDDLKVLPLICQGLASTSVLMETGEEVILSVIGAGTFIALPDWLQERREFSLSAQSLSDVTVVFIKHDELRSVIASQPKVRNVLLRQIGAQMKSLEHRLITLQGQKAHLRVLSCLIDLVHELGVPAPFNVTPPLRLSQTCLAQLTGLTRETVSRSLRKLQKDRLIILHGREILLASLQRAQKALYSGSAGKHASARLPSRLTPDGENKAARLSENSLYGSFVEFSMPGNDGCL